MSTRAKNSTAPTRAGVPSALGDALFSKCRQKVLAALFGSPGRSFFANELIRMADCGTGAVQRELATLEQVGLVRVTRIGNQKHFQVNSSAPVFPALRDLVRQTWGLADTLRAALSRQSKHITAAFVFGSMARGDEQAHSDVDLLVLSDTIAYGELFSLLEHAASELGRRVNPTLYTTAEFRRRRRGKNAFLTRVLTQPKIWVLGGDDDLPA